MRLMAYWASPLNQAFPKPRSRANFTPWAATTASAEAGDSKALIFLQSPAKNSIDEFLIITPIPIALKSEKMVASKLTLTQLTSGTCHRHWGTTKLFEIELASQNLYKELLVDETMKSESRPIPSKTNELR